jgi:hypothetical protein
LGQHSELSLQGFGQFPTTQCACMQKKKTKKNKNNTKHKKKNNKTVIENFLGCRNLAGHAHFAAPVWGNILNFPCKVLDNLPPHSVPVCNKKNTKTTKTQKKNQ